MCRSVLAIGLLPFFRSAFSMLSKTRIGGGRKGKREKGREGQRGEGESRCQMNVPRGREGEGGGWKTDGGEDGGQRAITA